MKPLVVLELACSFYVLLTLISQIAWKDKSSYMTRFKLLSISTLLWLLIDAVCYMFNGKISSNILYPLELSTYLMTNISFICFLHYCDAYLNRKTKLNKWIFLAPIILISTNTVVDMAYYFSGKLVEFDGNTFTIIGNVSIYTYICYAIAILYSPIIAIIKRKDVGKKPIILLIVFVVPIIAAVIINLLLDEDYSVVLCSLSVIVVAKLFQNELYQEKLSGSATHLALADNNMRILALEDEFESLYDINLETNCYETYVKGNNYGNIVDRFVNENNFFEDLKKNVINYIYEEDRNGLLEVLSLDYLNSNLKDKPYIEYFYRIIADEKTLWCRLRIVYKDANKKNIIVGIFDAEKEMAYKIKKDLEDAKAEELLNGVAKDYEAAIIGYVKDGSYRVISSRKEIDDIITGAKNLHIAVRRYVSQTIHPADKETIRSKYMQVEDVISELKIGEQFSMDYRSSINGDYSWYRGTLTLLNADEVLLGIRNYDKEMQDRIVNDILMAGYDAIYMVDLDKEEVRIAKSNGNFSSDKIKYSQAILQFAKYVNQQYKNDWINFCDVEYMRSYMAEEDHREYVYELAGSEKVMRRFSIDVIDRVKGVANALLFSFVTIDDQRAKMILLDKELAEQKLLLDYFIKTFTSAYFVNLVDNTFVVVHMEEKIKSRFGVNGEGKEVMEKFIDEHIHPDDREEMLKIISSGYVPSRLKNEKSFTFTTREVFDDEICYMRGLILKVSDPEHIAVGFMNITDEIKQEQEHQKQLEDALSLSENASKAKSEFLFSMSHDIRTPINAIIGFNNMAIKYSNDKNKVDDCMLKIQQSSRLLLSLINSILDMGKIESGKDVIDKKKIDIYSCFKNFNTTMIDIAKSKNISLTFEFVNIVDKYVYFDFERCTRIFVNIISNAIKYTNEGGCVNVLCEQTNRIDNLGYYCFTISDNGIGMSDDFQKHVFERFTRENIDANSSIEGSGLGMAVCKSYVESLNGTIECKSNINEGTSFIVTLPLTLAEDNLDDISDLNGIANIENDKLKNIKALLVEDNELNREIAIEILNEEGIEVEEANDGSIAVEILKEKGPSYYDVILMDIQMPIMNGYEATEKIRKMYPDAKLPIIALSANAFTEDKEKAIASGMNDHIAKPINVKELMNAIKKLTN